MSGEGEELPCSTSEGTSGTSGENSPQPILSSPDPFEERDGDSIFEECELWPPVAVLVFCFAINAPVRTLHSQVETGDLSARRELMHHEA